MTSEAKSILSSDAVSIGLFDGVMGRNVEEFQKEVESVAQEVSSDQYWDMKSIITFSVNLTH